MPDPEDLAIRITPRTDLWLGTQGLPGLPLRK